MAVEEKAVVAIFYSQKPFGNRYVKYRDRENNANENQK